MLAMIAPVIRGMDSCVHAEIWQRMPSITYPRHGGLGDWVGLPAPLPCHLRGQFMGAVTGIDVALWDTKEKVTGRPVFRLLGGTRIDVFACAAVGALAGGHEVAKEPFDQPVCK
jgi:L-alanine-DL-glutamate epimerase-like enolase superfamily enzyme